MPNWCIEPDDIVTYAGRFMDEYGNVFSRERSYDIVHGQFREFSENPPEDETERKNAIDGLARNLYMFLSSWGMLRNSFLLKYNYRCLSDVCETVCDKKYRWLFNADPLGDVFYENRNIELFVDTVLELNGEIRKLLYPFTLEFRKNSAGPTHTLVSKILLVTFGCIPAYDTQAKKALKEMRLTYTVISKKGLNDLLLFVQHYKGALEAVMDKYASATEGRYTVMKYVDMVLWKYGETLSDKV